MDAATDVNVITSAPAKLVGSEHVVSGETVLADYAHDEALSIAAQPPAAVVRPGDTADVASILALVAGRHVPVTASGTGTGLSGAGGNVATNAGGMRAVRYGVTRQQVLGLEAVLAVPPSGAVIGTGGKLAKASTGYDLTQLIVDSEGTLALVTDATPRLHPRHPHQATVLAPYRTADEVAAAVPRVLASGIGPLILEYIDTVTMAAMTHAQNLELGIPDVYVLPGPAARRLVDAREKAFWTAEAIGAHDIVDAVVPRASIPEFLRRAKEIAERHGSFVAGCGHAGDGNVHLSVFQPDAEIRSALLRNIFVAGMALGGLISGEHGIGRTKKAS